MRLPFFKPVTDLEYWIENLQHPSSNVEQEMISRQVDELQLPQLSAYEDWVPKSSAYRWLLAEIYAQNILSCPQPSALGKVRSTIRDTLRSHRGLRKLSRRKPLPVLQITFHLVWQLQEYIDHLGLFPPPPSIWDTIICLTGTWHEAQALTVAEYIHQTWPTAGNYLLILLSKLMVTPVGQECTCRTHKAQRRVAS
jgi:hypothetical protein